MYHKEYHKSIIHKFNPILKLISLLIIIVSINFIDNLAKSLLILVHLLTCILWSNISIKKYYEKLMLFKYILLVILVFSIIINDILFTYKIILILTYIILYIMTTSFNKIFISIENILILFKRFNVNKLILNLSLGFKFISIYEEELSRLKLMIKIKNIRLNIKEIFLVYYKAYKFAINRLMILKEVMYVKLYDYLVRRNKQKNIIRKRDIFIFIINICIMILLIRKR